MAVDRRNFWGKLSYATHCWPAFMLSDIRSSTFFFMKKHDKFLSTFPLNLEKNYVKNIYRHTLLPSLYVAKFVICGFLGCHLWLLTLSLAASEPLICHKWEPQSIALTTPNHSFYLLKRCKENGSCWFSTTCKIAHFSHICPRKKIFFNRWPSREAEIQNNLDNQCSSIRKGLSANWRSWSYIYNNMFMREKCKIWWFKRPFQLHFVP